MEQVDRENEIGRLVSLAVARGARVARLDGPSAVVTGEWVRLKCQYGCDGYGQCLTCPPHSPTPAVTRRMVDEYHDLLLVHMPNDWRRLRELMAFLEREAFLAGFHKAFAMGSGPCHICERCPVEHPCAHPDEARPSMEACGIDVYATARNAGFHIEVVRSRDCAANYFSLLLID